MTLDYGALLNRDSVAMDGFFICSFTTSGDMIYAFDRYGNAMWGFQTEMPCMIASGTQVRHGAVSHAYMYTGVGVCESPRYSQVQPITRPAASACLTVTVPHVAPNLQILLRVNPLRNSVYARCTATSHNYYELNAVSGARLATLAFSAKVTDMIVDEATGDLIVLDGDFYLKRLRSCAVSEVTALDTTAAPAARTPKLTQLMPGCPSGIVALGGRALLADPCSPSPLTLIDGSTPPTAPRPLVAPGVHCPIGLAVGPSPFGQDALYVVESDACANAPPGHAKGVKVLSLPGSNGQSQALSPPGPPPLHDSIVGAIDKSVQLLIRPQAGSSNVTLYLGRFQSPHLRTVISTGGAGPVWDASSPEYTHYPFFFQCNKGGDGDGAAAQAAVVAMARSLQLDLTRGQFPGVNDLSSLCSLNGFMYTSQQTIGPLSFALVGDITNHLKEQNYATCRANYEPTCLALKQVPFMCSTHKSDTRSLSLAVGYP
jgi:hypothetical protein